jgi:hypothetical protein
MPIFKFTLPPDEMPEDQPAPKAQVEQSLTTIGEIEVKAIAILSILPSLLPALDGVTFRDYKCRQMLDVIREFADDDPLIELENRKLYTYNDQMRDAGDLMVMPTESIRVIANRIKQAHRADDLATIEALVRDYQKTPDNEFLLKSLVTRVNDLQKQKEQKTAIESIWGQQTRPGSKLEAISRRPEVILDGLLYARSKLILGGVAKAGKSYFAMKLANALATGSKFLQWTATKPQKVLYIDFELHEWELDERCSHVCDWRVPDNLGTISLRKHHLVRDTASLGRVIAQEGMGANVIILDCLYKFNDAEDENDNAAMKAIGAWMDGIISLTGAAVILIHHFGKGGGQGRDAIDRFRGASSIVGEMDAILGLAKHEDDGHFIIETTARSFKPTSPFVAHWDFPHWVMAENKDASKAAKPGIIKSISDEDLLNALPVGPENAKRIEEINQPLSADQFKARLKRLPGWSHVWIESGKKGQKPMGYYRWQ